MKFWSACVLEVQQRDVLDLPSTILFQRDRHAGAVGGDQVGRGDEEAEVKELHLGRRAAEALGRSERGEAVIAAYDDKVADLRAALGERLNEAVSVVRFLPGQIPIYQLDSFSGVLLQDVGFDRPANQDVNAFAIRTGKESIPEMDGDRIFHFTYDTGNGEGEARKAEVLEDPLWQSLSAVQAGRVHEVSDAIWNTAGGVQAAMLMLEDIARIYGVE